MCDEAPLCSRNNPCLALAVLQCKSLQCLRLAFFGKVSTRTDVVFEEEVTEERQNLIFYLSF